MKLRCQQSVTSRGPRGKSILCFPQLLMAVIISWHDNFFCQLDQDVVDSELIKHESRCCCEVTLYTYG